MSETPAALKNKAVVMTDEPWGAKDDREPCGKHGLYDNERLQVFEPNGATYESDVIDFLTSPTQPDVLALCQIVRVRSRPGTSKRKPAYTFSIQSNGSKSAQHLLETHRTIKGKHVYYRFFVGDTCLGKLKCNFSAKKFTLFNNGLKVNKKGLIPYHRRSEEFREELASVSYSRSSRGPRQLIAAIPQGKNGSDSMFLVNKIPAWDPELRVHTLKYHHRALVKSVKNFQLVVDSHRRKSPPVLLRFGKVTDNKFNLDFRGPLTPLQAFALALTAFEKNWSESII
jgi:hypothetical protein